MQHGKLGSFKKWKVVSDLRGLDYCITDNSFMFTPICQSPFDVPFAPSLVPLTDTRTRDTGTLQR